MSFTFFSVGSVKVKFVEVPNEKVSAFFKANRAKIFSKKISHLPKDIVKKIEQLAGTTEGMGYADTVDVIGLALADKCPEAYQVIEFLQQDKDNCRYLVGK
jgi:hypothetical protein